MDMSQRSIIEPLQDIIRYLVYISYRADFRVHTFHLVRLLSCGEIELMAHKHVSLAFIDLFPFDQPVNRVVVGQIISVLICADDLLYHGRFHEGQQIEIHPAVFVV